MTIHEKTSVFSFCFSIFMLFEKQNKTNTTQKTVIFSCGCFLFYFLVIQPWAWAQGQALARPAPLSLGWADPFPADRCNFKTAYLTYSSLSANRWQFFFSFSFRQLIMGWGGGEGRNPFNLRGLYIGQAGATSVNETSWNLWKSLNVFTKCTKFGPRKSRGPNKNKKGLDNPPLTSLISSSDS